MSPLQTPNAALRPIPGVILQFLDRASVAVGCTRDRALRPHLRWVSGWQVDQDRNSLWCFIPREFMTGLLESLEENGHFALTTELIGPHECYQFKGRHLEHRAVTDQDRAIVETCRDRFSAHVRAHLRHAPPDQYLRCYILDPAIAIRFRVREIYLQTPGPGAGRLLSRLEGSS
jgi:hypothetical protein